MNAKVLQLHKQRWISKSQLAWLPQSISVMHPDHFYFLFRLWRSWKLHEKYRCGFAFSLTVSFSWVETVLCVTCLHMSQNIRLTMWPCDKAVVWRHLRFSLLRLPKAEGEDRPLGGAKGKGVDWCVILLLLPRAAASSTCVCFTMTDVWLTDSPRLLPTRERTQSTFTHTHTHTPRVLPEAPWSPAHSHLAVFKGAEAQHTCNTLNYGLACCPNTNVFTRWCRDLRRNVSRSSTAPVPAHEPPPRLKVFSEIL